jgi:hypothetical protein
VEILEYIINEALIIIPVLWILGSFLKRTPKVQDWIIPWVLLLVGVILAVGIIGLTVDAAVQGILVAGAAVLGHQLLKQTTERK